MYNFSMLRKLVTTIFTVLTCLLIFSRFSHSVSAASIGGKAIIEAGQLTGLIPTNDKSPFRSLREFCQKRTGDQMNLETWYAGKCSSDPKANPQMPVGDQVGFANIVRLEAMEYVIGYQNKDYDEMMAEQLDNIVKAATTYDYSPDNPTLLTSIGQGITKLFKSPAASSYSYASHVAENLSKHKVISPAYAADEGYGFNALKGFLQVWKAFRNMSYILFTIVFVIYGFMIMFRINFGGKTAVTIQLAIPNIIFTLLIITFSYAIVGLLIDLMYISLGLIVGLFSSVGLLKPDATYTSKIPWSAGSFGLFPSFFENIGLTFIASTSILNVIFAATTSGVVAFLVGIVNFFVGIIIFLVVLVAMIFVYGKLFFTLLGNYISIVLSLIFSPIVLLGNIWPGSKTFSNWIKGITANLASFSAAFFFLLLSAIFMVQPLCSIVEGLPGNPKCIDVFGIAGLTSGSTLGSQFPLIYPGSGGDPTAIIALVGLGMLLGINKYVKTVKDTIQSKELFAFGGLSTEVISKGFGTVQKGYNRFKELGKTKPGKP